MPGAFSNLRDLLFVIMTIHSRVIKQSTEERLIWVPAHKSILGNETVDKLAIKEERKHVQPYLTFGGKSIKIRR